MTKVKPIDINPWTDWQVLKTNGTTVERWVNDNVSLITATILQPTASNNLKFSADTERTIFWNWSADILCKNIELPLFLHSWTIRVKFDYRYLSGQTTSRLYVRSWAVIYWTLSISSWTYVTHTVDIDIWSSATWTNITLSASNGWWGIYSISIRNFRIYYDTTNYPISWWVLLD